MKNLKLAKLNESGKRSEIKVGNCIIGRDFVVIAGPCSVESEDQTLKTAEAVKKGHGNMLRGGAFKPRTSPYDFRDSGSRVLKSLKRPR